ncbi:MAG: hypothetical protein ACK559_35770, partial [bacterium]
VGTLVAHGHDFSTRLKLFKVLGCQEERTHKLNDTSGRHQGRKPQRQVNFGVFGNERQCSGLLIFLLSRHIEEAKIILSSLKNGGYDFLLSKNVVNVPVVGANFASLIWCCLRH